MNSLILLTIFVIIVAFIMYEKEYFYSTTYVSTPGFTGTFPTDITANYWRNRYIDTDRNYLRYAVVPYLPWRGRPIWRPRNRRFRRFRRRWW